jgi:hypothetical protein
MHKYAAVTAVAIALSIAMLTPAVSGGGRGLPRHEEQCDGRPDWGRTYVISCHCSFECNRQYSYTVTVRCWPWQALYWQQRGRHEGLCDVPLANGEPVRACVRNCMAAKGEPPPLPRP